MQEEQNVMVEEEALTPEAPQQEAEVEVQAPTYTKQQVEELMKKRIERSHNSFFKRYGVQNLDALDELFNKSREYDKLNESYASMQLKNNELLQTNAFLRNNVSPEKYDDISTYFKGKGIDFSEEELLKAISTHPEWLNVPKVTTTIEKLGSEAHATSKEDEKEIASKIFGVNF